MDLALEITDDGAGLDLALDGADLATESGLRSAVLVSLLTDRRAEADDEIPDGTDDRRGWWADTWPEVEGDRIGSRLWLLGRAKHLPDTLTRAGEYAEEALAWLVEDGIATAVRVTAAWVRRGVLGLRVSITLQDRSQYDDIFNYALEAL